MKSERWSVETAGWTGVAGDLILALLKGVAGYVLGSKALMGDGLYATADAVTGLVRRFNFWKSPLRRGRDRGGGKSGRHIQHINPQSRSVTPVLFAVLLLLTGLELGSRTLRSLLSGEPGMPEMYAMIVALAAVVLKELFFQFRYRWVNKKNEAEVSVLIQEHRSSLYSSVAALFGTTGAMAGQQFGLDALFYLDTLAGLFIACLVLRKGYLLIVESVHGSFVGQPHEEEIRLYVETIQRVRGIVTVESLEALEFGGDVIIDALISVDPCITVQEAQEIANHARALLQTRFAQVLDVKIQFSPYRSIYPYKTNHELPDNDVSPLIQ